MYFRALSFSIFVHAIFTMILAALEAPQEKHSEKQKVVQIEYIDLSEKQRVSDATAPNLDLLNQVPSKYSSKKYQRVEKQSIAKYSGKTENRSPIKTIRPELLPPLNSDNQGKGLLSKNENKQKDTSKSEQVFDQVKQEEVYDNIFDKLGTSRLQDRIFEDIKYGNFTALNTDRNQFFSFYERIDEQIRIRWYENIENQIQSLKIQDPNAKFSKREWLSQIVLILNRDGKIVNSYVARSSGAKHWDNAAVTALQTAAPFINPPKEMIESDGNIRLKYSFSLQLN